MVLDDLRRQGDDFHELFFAQLTRDWSENPRPARVQFLIDDNNRIAVKSETRAVAAADRVAGAHHDGIDNFAFLYRAIRRGFLDVRLNNVADVGVTLIAAEDTDGRGALGASIISHIQNGTNL